MSIEAARMWSWWWTTSNKTDEISRDMLTFLVPLVILIWFVWSVKRQKKRNFPLPPGPRGLPLVGYLPFLSYEVHHCFKELAMIYGPIFKLRLGSIECIVFTSPSLVKEVVKDQDVVFANRLPNVAANTLLFGTLDIAFSNYGPQWRKMRKIFASEMLSNARLDASYYLRKQHIKNMLHETCKNAGELVDVGEIALKCLVGSVMSMIWGDALEGDKCSVITAEFRAVVNEQLELLGAPNISDFFPLLARFDLQGIGRRMRVISRRIEDVFDKAIDHVNIGDNIKRKDFLGHLLQLTEGEDSTRSLTLPQVKSMLMDAAIGGTDTTVSMVEWAMAEILQNPKVLKNIQEELTEIVGLNCLIEEAHLPKLKYLNAVVKETRTSFAPTFPSSCSPLSN